MYIISIIKNQPSFLQIDFSNNKKKITYNLPSRFSLRLFFTNKKLKIKNFYLGSVESPLDREHSTAGDPYLRKCNISFENLDIESFYILSSSDNFKKYVQYFFERISFLFKNTNIYQLEYIENVSSVNIDTRTRLLSHPLEWQEVLKNIARLNIKGKVSLDRNPLIDHNIFESFYNYFLERNIPHATEEMYTILLNKYKKLKETNHTNKLILWISSLLSNHRTNIFLPISYLTGLVLILFLITYHTEQNVMFLLFPGAAFNITDDVFYTETIYIFIWLEQIVVAVLYYELIVISRKFVRRI